MTATGWVILGLGVLGAIAGAIVAWALWHISRGHNIRCVLHGHQFFTAAYDRQRGHITAACCRCGQLIRGKP
jgi:hypothetical protein